MASKKPGRRRKYAKSPRKIAFEQNIRSGLNASEAARQAGYTESTVHSKSSDMAQDVRIELMQELRGQKFNGKYVARGVVRLSGAKIPPATQLQALIFGAKLLGWQEPEEQGNTRPVQIIFPANFSNLTVKAEANG